MNKVMKDMVVTFRYVMYDDNKTVLENTTADRPTCYIHGTDTISETLQQQLEGLKEKENAQISLLKTNNDIPADYFFTIYIDEVRPAHPKELQLGYPLYGAHCEEDCQCFNYER
jgi:hypothetical protein